MKRIVVMFSMISPLALAQSAFDRLHCQKVISDDLSIDVNNDQMNVRWQTRGGANILRALADERIPTRLLRAYGDVVVEFSLPADDCKFSTDSNARFACRTVNAEIPVKIQAKVSPYEAVTPDVYAGILTSVDFKTKFSGNAGRKYLTFAMKFGVSQPQVVEVAEESAFFFAHVWESSGFRQPPSCRIDGEYVTQ